MIMNIHYAFGLGRHVHIEDTRSCSRIFLGDFNENVHKRNI